MQCSLNDISQFLKHHHTYIRTQLQYFPQQKKRRNESTCSAAEARRASFTPFVVSTDGMLSSYREANFLLKRLAQSISIEWDKPQDGCMQNFLCGSHTKWRSGVGIDDGAGPPAELPKPDYNMFFYFVILLFMFSCFFCACCNGVSLLLLLLHT